MANNTSKSSYMSSNWIMLVLGVWLFISPWVFTAASAAVWSWNFWIVGIALGGFALAALSRVAQWEDWVNLVLSGWLFFSPWILGFSNQTNVAWNAYIVAIVAAAASIWGVYAAREVELENYHSVQH